MSNSLDPNQARHSQAGQNVGPDLGPNCLQRLTADDISGKDLKSKMQWFDLKLS